MFIFVVQDFFKIIKRCKYSILSNSNYSPFTSCKLQLNLRHTVLDEKLANLNSFLKLIRLVSKGMALACNTPKV